MMCKSKGLNRTLRILFGIGIPLIVIGLIVYLYGYGSPFPCAFYQLLSVYCTGCGAGRAAFDLIHFDILGALGHNMLFTLVSPFVAYYIIKIYIRITFNKDPLPFFNISLKLGYIILLVVVVFTILRNIPVFPFSMLAP